MCCGSGEQCRRDLPPGSLVTGSRRKGCIPFLWGDHNVLHTSSGQWRLKNGLFKSVRKYSCNRGIYCLSSCCFGVSVTIATLLPVETTGKDGNGKKIGAALCNRCSFWLWAWAELNPIHMHRERLQAASTLLQDLGISVYVFHISWKDAKQNLIACGEIFPCG